LESSPDLQSPGPSSRSYPRRNRSTGSEVILKIVNPHAKEKSCGVELNGSPAIQPEGEAIVLSSGSLDDQNSLDNPEKVAPRTTKLANLGAAFDFACPPLSLSTLKLKTAHYHGRS
jgi:alpha-L-arabinofuranosidase